MKPPPHIDLRALARQAMADKGFLTDFPEAVGREVEAAREPAKDGSILDLTGWLWSSIDNDDSRDLDQAEYIKADGGGWTVYVAVADVDRFAPKGSAAEGAAAHNTTSVYTGVETFPMLPTKFSTDLSSLNEGQDRAAVVMELAVAGDGRVTRSTVYAALIRNKAQLTYNAVAAWLAKNAGDSRSAPSTGITSNTLRKIEADGALKEQLLLQHKAACALRERRVERGALEFQANEWRGRLSADGHVELDDRRSNAATQLIEDFMIAANQAMAAFLEAAGSPVIQRVVRTPKKWDRIVQLAAEKGAKLPPEPDAKALQAFLTDQKRKDPERYPDLSLSVIKLLGRGEYVVKAPGNDGFGHFGLAVQDYTHSTAPNRRYPDLLVQHLLKAVFAKKPLPYTQAELESLARHCTEKEDDANKVERFVGKCLAALSMAPRVGTTFAGLITGASDAGTWVRLSSPPVEGRVEGNAQGVQVGERVEVRLDSVNPMKGFIDFSLVRRLS